MSQVYSATTVAKAPVSLKEARSYLKIPDSVETDDDLIVLFVKAATEFAEKYTRRDFRAKTWLLKVDEFEDRIELRRDDVDAITKIEHLVSTVLTTVATTIYYLKLGTQAAEVLLLDGQAWPTDTDVREQVVEITFTTQAHASVDQARIGILRHVAFLYENRGDCDPKTGNAAELSGATFLYDQIRVSRV